MGSFGLALGVYGFRVVLFGLTGLRTANCSCVGFRAVGLGFWGPQALATSKGLRFHAASLKALNLSGWSLGVWG